MIDFEIMIGFTILPILFILDMILLFCIFASIGGKND